MSCEPFGWVCSGGNRGSVVLCPSLPGSAFAEVMFFVMSNYLLEKVNDRLLGGKPVAKLRDGEHLPYETRMQQTNDKICHFYREIARNC